ncbi:MAG: site-2 protease family protein [Acidimicrobiales bacterium]
MSSPPDGQNGGGQNGGGSFPAPSPKKPPPTRRRLSPPPGNRPEQISAPSVGDNQSGSTREQVPYGAVQLGVGAPRTGRTSEPLKGNDAAGAQPPVPPDGFWGPPGQSGFGAGPGRGSSRSAPRLGRHAPNAVIVAAVLGIIVIAVVAGVRSHHISIFTVIYFGVLIPSIMFHEVMHGVVALWCGDDTAKRAGRISANPLRHVDPIGTIVLPLIMVLSHGPAFGWAKPVPVDLNRLRHPRNQAVLVGLVGPISNFVLAAIAGGVLHLLLVTNPAVVFASGGTMYWVVQVVLYTGLANIWIGTFNLLPIPPLDGASLIERLLPRSALPGYYRMRSALLVLVLFFVLFDQNALSSIFTHVGNWYLGLFI